MPGWAQAGGWGLLSGSALIIGALIAYFAAVPSRIIAFVMSFGSGVLISALSFELMEEGFRQGGLWPTASDFVAGATVYTFANVWLSRRGAKHRKRSGEQQPSDADSGTAIALGALLDGVPESVVIGVSLLGGAGGGAGVSLTAVIAIFLSNIPEGLSSASGMKKAGRSALYIFGLWTGITVISGIAALLGYVIVGDLGPEVVAATNAVAAGAILSMIADTMIPEDLEANHDYAGLVTVIGFLIAFGLSHLGADEADARDKLQGSGQTRRYSNAAASLSGSASGRRQIAPGGRAGDAQRENRQIGERHCAVLRIAVGEERLRRSCSGPVSRNSAGPRSMTQPSRLQSSSQRSTTNGPAGFPGCCAPASRACPGASAFRRS